MTPPEAPHDGTDTILRDRPPAVSSCLTILTKRPDFQRASRARHTAMAGFVVQMRCRKVAELPLTPEMIRVGFTCSKKVGNAVARNRAKRRLREVARLILPGKGQAGHDYVLIGRKGVTATLPFDQMLADFNKALDILHGTRK
ncbi:MAG: ribonuclease P protein component [Sulfitobacter sp.]|jgi:ribonuclease P protein component